MIDLIGSMLLSHNNALENTFSQKYKAKLIRAANLMQNSLLTGNKIVLFGNGGSAADAQHIAAELISKLSTDRIPLPSLALTVNSSVITAIANDYGYDSVFARQVQALVSKGDTVIGITTSGKSKNVILGLEAAKERQANTIALTGKLGLEGYNPDVTLSINASEIAAVQELHILTGHILCKLAEQHYV